MAPEWLSTKQWPNCWYFLTQSAPFCTVSFTTNLGFRLDSSSSHVCFTNGFNLLYALKAWFWQKLKMNTTKLVCWHGITALLTKAWALKICLECFCLANHMQKLQTTETTDNKWVSIVPGAIFLFFLIDGHIRKNTVENFLTTDHSSYVVYWWTT